MVGSKVIEKGVDLSFEVVLWEIPVKAVPTFVHNDQVSPSMLYLKSMTISWASKSTGLFDVLIESIIHPLIEETFVYGLSQLRTL